MKGAILLKSNFENEECTEIITPELTNKKPQKPTPFEGNLRAKALRVPPVIRKCSGIFVFGKRIKSFVFSTDLAIIKNVDADAVFAVHPFTPQSAITKGIVSAADVPVFAGVGGGITNGARMLEMAMIAEAQGVSGVVVNTYASNDHIKKLSKLLEVPIVATVAAEGTDIKSRIKSGVSILNVSAAADTPKVVAQIREQYPDIPIIATGGRTDESILETIYAGANAIVWTPPSAAEVYKDIMEGHRKDSKCGTEDISSV